jgi:hypothetical protein
MAEFFFRCKSNPTAPLLVLTTFWEAKEMRNHPDYERIDEFGELVKDEQDEAPGQIPLAIAGAKTGR